MKRTYLLAAAALSAALYAVPALAQTSTTTAPQTAKRAKRQPKWRGNSEPSSLSAGAQIDASARRFMQQVAVDGMTEVRLGEIASKNGSSDAVKEFGQRMVTDHSKANNELMQLAQSKGVTLPTSLDSKHQAMVAKFSSLHGAAFDSAYAKAMVKDHRKAVALFQARANNGRNTDLRMWTANTLPTLREHLHMAEQLQGSTKPEGKHHGKHK